MKIQQEELINCLKKDVEALLNCVDVFHAEKEVLLWQPAPGKWSIAQVLEHLNSYGRFYLPVIKKELSQSDSKRDAWFTAGFWGNLFTKSLQPKDPHEIKNKMKSPKDHSPSNDLDPDNVLKEFVEQQQTLLQLLELAREKSLNKVKVPISISRMIRLKLGDTFRFLVAHEQRHFIQARNTLKAAGRSTGKFPVILQAVPQ